jgi:hypothetical protein
MCSGKLQNLPEGLGQQLQTQPLTMDLDNEIVCVPAVCVADKLSTRHSKEGLLCVKRERENGNHGSGQASEKSPNL